MSLNTPVSVKENGRVLKGVVASQITNGKPGSSDFSLTVQLSRRGGNLV